MRAIYFLLSSAFMSLSASGVTLKGPDLTVELDSDFPRILSYHPAGTDAVLAGQTQPVKEVQLNGAARACEVALIQGPEPGQARYQLGFPDAGAKVELLLHVAPAVVSITARVVEEAPDHPVRSLALPGNALLTLTTKESGTAIAAVYATAFEPPVLQKLRERIGPLAGEKVGKDHGNYFFASGGSLACGLVSNHIVDMQRVAYEIRETEGVKICTIQNPEWLFRGTDGGVLPAPEVNVFITPDRNGDGKATWQDAALVCREVMPKPFGWEHVRSSVGDQVAMNFASGAQQPFLRILDAVKKHYLATDGLGQQILIKGFTAEGHDSANTDYSGHYNERAGGLTDLQYLTKRAGDFNARIGVHINASEVYPEAQRYHPDILRRDKNGNPVNGWQWLDRAHMIDKVKDTTSGRLFAALDQMREELPDLSFVYVDTYWTHGWTAWKIMTKLNTLGLPAYTEGNYCLDPWTTWAHWRGNPGQILRFLWFSQRDIFPNDELLRAGHHKGWLSWQGERDFHTYIRGVFGHNLPGKYLQNFELLKWTPGKEAIFSDGVLVRKEAEGIRCTRNGRTVMTWKPGSKANRLFVPWDPAEESRIYVWDEVGGAQNWELPPDWEKAKQVYLYPLSARGRGEAIILPVADGKVTINVAKNSAHVLYPQRAPNQDALNWGEGGLVKDPGFESRSLKDWRVLNHMPADLLAVEDDRYGNARLVIAPHPGGSTGVGQVIEGLEPGRSYAFSAWVQITGPRPASLMVELIPPLRIALMQSLKETTVKHKGPNDPRSGTFYQRLKLLVKIPAGHSRARIVLRADKGEGMVEFDDVRVVACERPPLPKGLAYFEDFENVDQGWGPFTWIVGERTHLSEANPPYTKDVIAGRYSLKTMNEPNGLVMRTVPSSLMLKPDTEYELGFDYICPPGSRYRIVVRGVADLDEPLPHGSGHYSGRFSTGPDEDPFLGIYKQAGGMLVLDNLSLKILGPAKPDAHSLPGYRILHKENLRGQINPLWRIIRSAQPGTSVVSVKEGLVIRAGANVSACIERPLPRQTTAVACRLNADQDPGETWGGGLALHWPGSQILRINLRGENHSVGIDAEPGGQRLTGIASGGGEVDLRIRLEDEQILLELRRTADPSWKEAGRYPRKNFPGHPHRVQLGKIHGVEGLDDHSDPGAPAKLILLGLTIYGR